MIKIDSFCKNKRIVFVFLSLLSLTNVVQPSQKQSRVARLVQSWYESKFPQKAEITYEQYPKARNYFDSLRVKYPVPLGSVCIMMVHDDNMGPCCIGKTILFPSSWVQQLEDGNVDRLLQTEWVILHEAGHVHHRHSITSGLLQSLPLGLVSSCMILYVRWKAEPQADNFACEHCQSVESMQAVIDWFKKDAVNDLAHPTIKSRIAKIEKAMKTKIL